MFYNCLLVTQKYTIQYKSYTKQLSTGKYDHDDDDDDEIWRCTKTERRYKRSSRRVEEF